MKKFMVSLIVLALCLFTVACGSTTSKGDTDCDPDEEDCSNTTDEPTDSTTEPTTEPTDSTTDPTTEPSDEPTNPTDDPEEPASTGVITQIQKGEIAEGTEVTTECVVTGIYYAQDDDFNNTAIKGIYVSELIKKAQPYSGIYVFIKETAAVDEYKIGDKLEVKGTHKEYYENSQIEAAEIKKLGTADVPEAAEIADPASIATPFEVSGQDENGYDTYDPTANHGADAEKYEGVLVKVTDVEITNKYIGHGNFELDNSLVVTKTLYYYDGDRSKGIKFESVEGILVYEYDAFRLAPRAKTDFVEGDNNTTDPTDPTAEPTEPAEVETTTIKAIQSGTKAKGDLVKIENAIVISPVVSKNFDDGGTGYTFYVSDGKTGDYSGIYIYNVTAETAPAKGDKVTIEGQVDFYGSQWEIKNAKNAGSITKTGTGTVPAAVEKASADLAEKDKGTYFDITTELTVQEIDSHNNVTFTNGFVIKPFSGVSFSLANGDTCFVKGIYDTTYGVAGLVIIDANDIVKQ